MFCPKCGEIVRDTALKCPSCGAALRRGKTKVNRGCDHAHGTRDTVEAGYTGWRDPGKWDRAKEELSLDPRLQPLIDSIRRCTDFHGRTSFRDFRWAAAFYVGVWLLLHIVWYFLPPLWLCLTLLPFSSLVVRRLHDAGVHHNALLALFIPFVGIILVVSWLVQPSTSDNEWGPRPQQ